jgi:hypothetical protein
MGQGLQRAFAAAAATRATPPNEPQLKFLRSLARWQGVASSRDLGPQISQEENSARQGCRRKGFVTFDGHYWRMTEAGRSALRNG